MEKFNLISTTIGGEEKDYSDTVVGYVNPITVHKVSAREQAKEMADSDIYNIVTEEKLPRKNYDLLRKDVRLERLRELYNRVDGGIVFYSVRSVFREDLSLILKRAIDPEWNGKIGFLHSEGESPEGRFLTVEEMEDLRAALDKDRTLERDLLVFEKGKIDSLYLKRALDLGYEEKARFTEATDLLSYIEENYDNAKIPTIWVYQLESLLGPNYRVLEKLNDKGISIIAAKMDQDFYPLVQGLFARSLLNSKSVNRIVQRMDQARSDMEIFYRMDNEDFHQIENELISRASKKFPSFSEDQLRLAANIILTGGSAAEVQDKLPTSRMTSFRLKKWFESEGDDES